MAENIILCTSADSGKLVEIWRASILHRAGAAFNQQQIDAWLSRVRSPEIYAQEAKDRIIWGWKEKDVLQAFIELEPNGHIDRLYAIKETANRGIATKLVQHVVSYARDNGYSKLFTEASDLAHRVFERCEFNTIRKNYVTINDVEMHNWIMERDLN